MAGQGVGRWRGNPPGRDGTGPSKGDQDAKAPIGVLLWFLIPLFAVIILQDGAREIGPAREAASGHGTHGFFVAEVDHCDNRSVCYWTGNFALPDGLVTRRNVTLFPSGNMYSGEKIPALDTGAPRDVFARSGSTAWIEDLVYIIVGSVVLALWALFMPVRRLRRRRRNRPQAMDLLTPAT